MKWFAHIVICVVLTGCFEQTNKVEQVPSVKLGSSVFNGHCLRCHGAKANGGPLVRFALYEREASNDKSLFLHKVTEGVEGTLMKGFGGKLSETEKESVWLYIQDLKQENSDGKNGNTNEQ